MFVVTVGSCLHCPLPQHCSVNSVASIRTVCPHGCFFTVGRWGLQVKQYFVNVRTQRLCMKKNWVERKISSNKELVFFLSVSGVVRTLFDLFYDEDIISEESFFEWERRDGSPDDMVGKGVVKMNVKDFFEWLRSNVDEEERTSWPQSWTSPPSFSVDNVQIFKNAYLSEDELFLRCVQVEECVQAAMFIHQEDFNSLLLPPFTQQKNNPCPTPSQVLCYMLGLFNFMWKIVALSHNMGPKSSCYLFMGFVFIDQDCFWGNWTLHCK